MGDRHDPPCPRSCVSATPVTASSSAPRPSWCSPGVIAYWPLLTLLVPMRVEVVSPDERIALLSLIAVAGAPTGPAPSGSPPSRSPHSWRRFRPAPAPSRPACPRLPPMMAVMAEEIRDARRGMAGALLALGNPVAAALSAWLVGESRESPAVQKSRRGGRAAGATMAASSPAMRGRTSNHRRAPTYRDGSGRSSPWLLSCPCPSRCCWGGWRRIGQQLKAQARMKRDEDRRPCGVENERRRRHHGPLG
jgi:hypothetical protein